MPLLPSIPGRRLLPGLLLLPWLTACGPKPPAGEAVLGSRSTVADTVRGAAPAADGALRPEPGDIWAEGLQTTRPPAAR